jgi:hypothetical protein
LRANWRSIPRGAQCRDGGRIKPGRRGNGGVIEAGLANQIEGCFAPGSILSLLASLLARILEQAGQSERERGPGSDRSPCATCSAYSIAAFVPRSTLQVPFQHFALMHHSGYQKGFRGVDGEDNEMARAPNRPARHSELAELDVVNEVRWSSENNGMDSSSP